VQDEAMSRGFQNGDFWEMAKQECSIGAVGEEERVFLLGIGRGGQHGVVAVRMEAKHHLAAWRSFDSQSLRFLSFFLPLRLPVSSKLKKSQGDSFLLAPRQKNTFNP
jgi:hypothetical protein